MKILSYNVNGIRAAINKGLIEWLLAADADVVCFQETKAQPYQIDTSLFESIGYPYTYWFSATKKGYSGVGIICKTKPKNVVYGTGISYMDAEGRNLRIDYDAISIMSLYLPSGTNEDRLEFKLTYMDDFQAYINHLIQEVPHLSICGDFNICHEPIDIHDPVRLQHVSGFLPVERQWLSAFLNSGFTDTFRFQHPGEVAYSWWSYRGGARANNKGWRLDYHLLAHHLQSKIKRTAILHKAMHSDHCPVLLELEG